MSATKNNTIVTSEVQSIIDSIVESYRPDFDSRFDRIEKISFQTFEEFKTFCGEDFKSFFGIGSRFFFLIDKFIKTTNDKVVKTNVLRGIKAAGSFEAYISNKREETFLEVTKNLKASLARRLPENTLSFQRGDAYCGVKGVEVVGQVYYKDGSSNQMEVRAIPVDGFFVSFHYRYLLTFRN